MKESQVEKIEYRDTVINSIEQAERQITEIQTRYEVKKRVDANGHTIRIPHDINENNIIVAQVIVDDVILEEVFKKRLEAQRDESAKRQLEQQKIKTAKDAQARIVAEGERDKAGERVTQEKEQVKALILFLGYPFAGLVTQKGNPGKGTGERPDRD